MKPYSTPIREYEQAVYVYWLGPNLPTVKIGHTNNPARRLEEFRRETGTPGHKSAFAAIVWLDRHRERVELAAHRAAREFRRDGEWFAMSASDAIDHIVAAAKAGGIRYEVEDCAGVWAETIARRECEAADAEILRLEAEAIATERHRHGIRLAGIAGALCDTIKRGPGQYDMSDPGSFKEYTNDMANLMASQKNWDHETTDIFREYYTSNQESFVMAVNEYVKRIPVEETPARKTAEGDYVAANYANHTASPFQLAMGAVLAGDKAEAHEAAQREEAQRAAEQIRLAAAQYADIQSRNAKRKRNERVILVLSALSLLLGFLWLVYGYKPDPEVVARHKAVVEACERSGGKYVPKTKFTRGVPECQK